MMKLRARTTKIWSAVTRHRFGRQADSSARQSRVERLEIFPRASQFGGDKSPAKSGENSPHSKSLWLGRKPRQGFESPIRSRAAFHR